MEAAIIFGSRSDQDKMKGAADLLSAFGIQYKAYILSAHRVPQELSEKLKEMEEAGCEVIIAGAGLAAHLPGVIASQTVLPVIGVPIDAALGGMDALLSIVQMPKAIPVAAVGINNSANAAMLCVEILALKYPRLKEKLIDYRSAMKKKFIEENAEGVEF